MNKVYCLYRVSDHGQVEENDIPMQRISCRTFAMERGWEVVKEFSEKGVSGYKLTLQERDALLEIREDALSGKFNILLVYMFDRIGRRDDETPFVVEWFVKHGIAVWSVCEGEQRFDNHVDKLTNYIRYWQAAGESAKISERTRTRIRQLTAEGQFTGGQCPYGYQLVHGRRLNKKKQPLYDLQINEDEAKVVRLIYEKTVKSGLGTHRLANFLNESEYRTRKGKPWNQSSVARILQSRLYLGILGKGGVESARIPELQIVSDELYDAAKEIRDARISETPESPTVPLQTKCTALLSGFLFCGHCGARINSTMQTKQYIRKDGTKNIRSNRKYRCNGRIDGVPTECDGQHIYQVDKVDAIFEKTLTTILENLEVLPADVIMERKYQIAMSVRRKVYNEAQAELSERQNDYNALRGEIARALQGKSGFALELLQSLLGETEQKIQTAKENLAAIEAEMQNVEQLKREINVKQQKYTGFKECFTSGTTEEKKMLLTQMVQRVELKSGYEMKITLSPSFDRFLDGLVETR